MIVSPQAIYQRELLTGTTEEIAGDDHLEPYPSVPIKRLTVCKSGLVSVSEMKYIACLHIPVACLTKLNIFMLIV